MFTRKFSIKKDNFCNLKKIYYFLNINRLKYNDFNSLNKRFYFYEKNYKNKIMMFLNVFLR